MEKAVAYGGIVVDDAGRILLRKPSGEFDEYAWTFPKGRPKPGQTPQQTALAEVLEETGWVCEVVGEILGTFEGGFTINRYFLMTPVRDTGRLDAETQEVRWVRAGEAQRLIRQTQNAVGRARDLAVLTEAIEVRKKLPR